MAIASTSSPTQIMPCHVRGGRIYQDHRDLDLLHRHTIVVCDFTDLAGDDGSAIIRSKEKWEKMNQRLHILTWV